MKLLVTAKHAAVLINNTYGRLRYNKYVKNSEEHDGLLATTTNLVGNTDLAQYLKNRLRVTQFTMKGNVRISYVRY